MLKTRFTLAYPIPLAVTSSAYLVEACPSRFACTVGRPGSTYHLRKALA